MKRKSTKRILAMILSVCMILTMMPSMVFASAPVEDPASLDEDAEINPIGSYDTMVVDEPASSMPSPQDGSGTITLQQDVTLTEAYVVPETVKVINLNGHNIKSDTISGHNYMILVDDGHELTIKDSSNGNGAIQSDSDSVPYAIFIKGKQDTPTKLTVESGKIIANTPISGNAQNDGTEITITGSAVLEGNNTEATIGIYHPQDGTLNIKGGTIKADIGVYMVDGTMNMTGGTVISTAENAGEINVPNTTVKPGAIVVNDRTEGAYGDIKEVKISGNSTIQSESEEVPTVSYYKDGEDVVEAPEGGYPIDIEGGTFTVGKDTAEKPDESSIKKFLNPTKDVDDDGNIVERTEGEAQIGEKIYETLEAAIEAATTDDTITLLKDVELPGEADGNKRIEVSKKITLDLNGNTLTKSTNLPAENYAGLKVIANGDLTLKDSQGSESTGKITGTGILLAAFDGGKLTLDGCKVEQTTGTDKENDCAVDTSGSGSTVIVKSGTLIDAAESGLGSHGAGTVTVEGGTINAGIYGVATNGSAADQNATVTVTGGEITGGSAGMYLPSQNGNTTISGDATVTGTNGAGIVVRGGKITIKEDEQGKTPTIIAKSSTAQTYGDSEEVVPAAALVLDTKDYGTNSKNAIIEGGKFEAPTGVDAVVLTSGATKDETNNSQNVNIKGGYFSNEIAKKYLDSTLNTKLESDNTPEKYSYYSSPADAKEEDPNGKVTLLDESKASIMFAGFIGTGRTDGNSVLNKLAPQVKGEGKKWNKTNNGIDDCIENTLYAAFKAKESAATEYKVEFKKEDKSYPETIKGVTEGGIAYVSFNDQAKNQFGEKPQGKYTATLTKGSDSAISTATIDVYKVTYTADTTSVTGDDVIRYTDKAGLDDAKNFRPEGFALASGKNKWHANDMAPVEGDDYSYTVTLSGYYQSSGGGGYLPPATTTPTPTPSVTPEGPTGPTLSFTDSRQEKALQNRTQMDSDCTLKLAPENGEDLTDYVVTSDNEDVVVYKDGKLHYVGVGSATVTVTATGKDSGTTYTVTFPVTVKEPKTPTFTPSNLSSTKKKTFTVTTSTIKGADGFEVQFSLKDLAKTTKGARITDIGGGKKSIRATVSTYKSGRVYYARVRAYKMVDGKKITTAWSPIKTRKSR